MRVCGRRPLVQSPATGLDHENSHDSTRGFLFQSQPYLAQQQQFCSVGLEDIDAS